MNNNFYKENNEELQYFNSLYIILFNKIELLFFFINGGCNKRIYIYSPILKYYLFDILYIFSGIILFLLLFIKKEYYHISILPYYCY